jgi:hypothetical protein
VLHNKPQGCGASVVSAAGPFTKKPSCQCIYDLPLPNVHIKRNVNCILNVHVSWTKHSLIYKLVERYYLHFFPVAHQPYSGLGRLIIKVSRSHTVTPHFGRTPLDEGSARRRDVYLTTRNTHKRQTSMPPAGFEPTIPASERPQTHSLDHSATGIDITYIGCPKYVVIL